MAIPLSRYCLWWRERWTRMPSNYDHQSELCGLMTEEQSRTEQDWSVTSKRAKEYTEKERATCWWSEREPVFSLGSLQAGTVGSPLWTGERACQALPKRDRQITVWRKEEKWFRRPTTFGCPTRTDEVRKGRKEEGTLIFLSCKASFRHHQFCSHRGTNYLAGAAHCC